MGDAEDETFCPVVEIEAMPAIGAEDEDISLTGSPAASMKTAWATAKRLAGIKRRLRPYDLRHAFATPLLDKGADLKSVSEMLGHKSIETTLKVYQHTSKELHRLSIDKLPNLG